MSVKHDATAPIRPEPLSQPRRQPHTLTWLAAGSIGGFLLGISARAWMRLISEDPEFTGGGTIAIVVGFTIFGLGQSAVELARRKPLRSGRVTVLRIVGAVTLLPLFGAAGAIMFPTVVGGCLAIARHDWVKPVRIVLVTVALAPVVFVSNDLVDAFGWSLRTIAGVTGLLAIYMTIIWGALRTFAPLNDGGRSKKPDHDRRRSRGSGPDRCGLVGRWSHVNGAG